jgi:hypothetical protein
MAEAPGDRYGLLGEFEDPAVVVAAAGRLRAAGYKCLDAFSPYPVDGLAEALGRRWNWVPLLALLGGLGGGAAGYGLQYWVAVIQYPLNVGGRPLHSWPAFIPITFEMTILGAAVAAGLGMLALNRLPQPHHPLFNVEAFARASEDRFFLLVEARDRRFDAHRTQRLLLGLGALVVHDVYR